MPTFVNTNYVCQSVLKITLFFMWNPQSDFNFLKMNVNYIPNKAKPSILKFVRCTCTVKAYSAEIVRIKTVFILNAGHYV